MIDGCCRARGMKRAPDASPHHPDDRPRSLAKIGQIGSVPGQPVAVLRLVEVALALVVELTRQDKVAWIVAPASGDRHAMVDLPFPRALPHELSAAVVATPAVSLGDV